MENFKFIELPKEEVLKEVELSFIEGGISCLNFNKCTDALVGKNVCDGYNTGDAACTCSSALFCGHYTF